MRAIVLAAGRGSRMDALTADRPKCLVELAGRPLLDRQTGALRRAGAAPIGVVRGYRGEMLEGRADTLFDNPRWAETNMVSSLACAAAWLREAPCIVSYFDIFYAPDVVAKLMTAAGDLAISYDRRWFDLWSRRFADPLSDAETFRLDDDGRIVEIGRRATDLSEVEGQYMGLLRFTPTAWAWVEALLAKLSATGGFVVAMERAAVIEAWRSHGTLARQAGERFDQVIHAIEAILDTDATVAVPYTTRLWLAPLAD